MMINDGYPLVICYSSPWKIDGPNRNRWFTVPIENGGSFHGYVSHNQRVNVCISRISLPHQNGNGKFIPSGKLT